MKSRNDHALRLTESPADAAPGTSLCRARSPEAGSAGLTLSRGHSARHTSSAGISALAALLMSHPNGLPERRACFLVPGEPGASDGFQWREGCADLWSDAQPPACLHAWEDNCWVSLELPDSSCLQALSRCWSFLKRLPCKTSICWNRWFGSRSGHRNLLGN